jgi:hypothetical protein
MKKIKITEKQARLLENLNTKKVVKITKEQYDKILEMEINEKHSNLIQGESKIEEINVDELYENFVNELYNVNEGGSQKIYEKLCNLMELAGILEKGKIKKEMFNADKKRVKEVITRGLYEMACGKSEYAAMEAIEEALNLKKDMTSDKLFSDLVEEWLNSNERHPNYKTVKRLFDNKDYKKAWLTSRANAMNEEGGSNEVELILNTFPFSELPETRMLAFSKEGNSGRVKGWGDVILPSISQFDSGQGITDKETLVKYLEDFKERYNVYPKFIINDSKPWYAKILIDNNEFNDDVKSYVASRQADVNKMRAAGEQTGLDEIEMEETSTASSSGQYTGLFSPSKEIESNVPAELEALKKK